MIRQVVTVKGKRYVLVPPADLRRLESLTQQAIEDEAKLPPGRQPMPRAIFPLCNPRVSRLRAASSRNGKRWALHRLSWRNLRECGKKPSAVSNLAAILPRCAPWRKSTGH